MAGDCSTFKSDNQLLCEMLEQLVILSGGAGSGLDFELRTVKDAFGDLFQLRMRLDEGTGTYTIEYIDANGVVATPVAPVEFLDPTAVGVTLGQQPSVASAPVVLSTEQEALIDDIIAELVSIGGDLTTISGTLTTISTNTGTTATNTGDTVTELQTLIALFTGTTVPKSDDISGQAAFTIPANSKNSVTLVVESGVVEFDGTVHPIGTYTWSAPLLKKLDAMVFDASGSTDAKILSTQTI